MIIYNLFPKLAGNFDRWKPHIDRAAEMGFDTVYLNPVQYPGFSGSCYSISDYFRIHEDLYGDPENDKDVHEQFKEIIRYIHEKGMKVVMDLVINHTAVDSPLVKLHPDWYVKDETGNIKNPVAMDGDRVVAVWGDLAEIDNYGSSDKENLWNYWKEVTEFYLGYGVDGFRCDAAYQVPVELWSFLINNARRLNGNVLFLAETLGCPFADVIKLGKAGFDYTFNSSKYWNFEDEWCLQQYEQNVGVSRSISFPESHDTIRMAEEVNGNIAVLKQRYIFSVFFSAAVMMPIGYEFGFRKKIDVVKTTPDDWEQTDTDISEIIRGSNNIKAQYAIFQDENPVRRISHDNDRVLLLLKEEMHGSAKALMILNKDVEHYQHFVWGDLSLLLGEGAIKDISPGYRLEYVPNDFNYDLRPGQVIILYRGDNDD